MGGAAPIGTPGVDDTMWVSLITHTKKLTKWWLGGRFLNCPIPKNAWVLLWKGAVFHRGSAFFVSSRVCGSSMQRNAYSAGAKKEWGDCHDDETRFYIVGGIVSATGRDHFFNTNKLWTMLTSIEGMENYMMKGLIVGVASLMDGIKEDSESNVLSAKADMEAAELLGEDCSVFSAAKGKKRITGTASGGRKGGKRKGGKRPSANKKKGGSPEGKEEPHTVLITKEMTSDAIGIIGVFMEKEAMTAGVVRLLRDNAKKMDPGHRAMMIMLSLVAGYLEAINRNRDYAVDELISACVQGIEIAFMALFNKPIHGRIYLSIVMGLFGIRSFAKKNKMTIEEARLPYTRHCFDISARSMQKNYVFFITVMSYIMVWNIVDSNGKVSKIDIPVYRRTLFSIEHLFAEAIKASPMDKTGLLTVFASILEHSHMYSGAVTILSSLILRDPHGSPNIGWCHYRIGKCYMGMDSEWGMHNMCSRVMHQSDAYVIPKPDSNAIRWRALLSFIQAMQMSSVSGIRTMAFLSIIDMVGITDANVNTARTIICANLGPGVEKRIQRIRDAVSKSTVKFCASCSCVDESKLTIRRDETTLYCSVFCRDMDAKRENGD